MIVDWNFVIVKDHSIDIILIINNKEKEKN